MLTAPASPPTSIDTAQSHLGRTRRAARCRAFDPDYNGSSNTRIYWTFSETGSGGSGTAVARGDLNAVTATISNAQVIYRQTPKVGGDGHFGSRLAFRSDKTLMVTLGERQTDDPATDQQQRTTPRQNPPARSSASIVTAPSRRAAHLQHPGALPEIWATVTATRRALRCGRAATTSGSPSTGRSVATSSTLCNRAQLHGWPLVVSYGCLQRRYQHTACPGGTGGVHAPDLRRAGHHLAAIITAPSGLIFYNGGKFTDLGWQAAPSPADSQARRSWRITLNSNAFVAKEEVTVVKNLGQRIRVVKQGPDGWLSRHRQRPAAAPVAMTPRHRAHANPDIPLQRNVRPQPLTLKMMPYRYEACSRCRLRFLQAIRGGVLARQRCHVVGNQSH